MANLQGPVSVLGFAVLLHIPPPYPTGVGLLCQCDDPQRHMCLEVTMPKPICDICHKPVKLETSKMNDSGRLFTKNATYAGLGRRRPRVRAKRSELCGSHL